MQVALGGWSKLAGVTAFKQAHRRSSDEISYRAECGR
jgi:hypothetical protein